MNSAIELPTKLPGHWETPDGYGMALAVRNQDRAALAGADISDFALANEIYMVDRGSMNLLEMQTAAKERIRWLSVQLAMAHNAMKDLMLVDPLGRDRTHAVARAEVLLRANKVIP